MMRTHRPFLPSILARLALCVLLLLAQATPVYAYLDPVSASFLFQGLIGGVVAVLAGFRTVRERVFGFFIRGKRKDDKSSSQDGSP